MLLKKLLRRRLRTGPTTAAETAIAGATAPVSDVDRLLAKGDVGALTGAVRDMEARARSAFADFVGECRVRMDYEDLKSSLRDDLKAVARLMKPGGGNDGAPTMTGQDHES